MTNWTKIEVDEKEFREANETFREIGFGNFMVEVEEVTFAPLPTPYVMSEWRAHNGNVEVHVFHLGRSLDRVWDHAAYAYALFNAIVVEFDMEHYQDRITVEFIPEVNGWYVLIKGVAMIKDPDPSRLVRILNSVRP